MKKLSKKQIIYLAGTAVVLIAAIVLLIVSGGKQKEAPKKSTVPAVSITEPDRTVIVKEKENLTVIEKEFTAQIIEDGLQDMGFLITQEYYFTEVVGYSSVKSIFNLELPFTESGYLISYDGVVEAGVDFRNISVVKNSETNTVRVLVPPAEIHSTVIDPDSFRLYEEKTGLGNPLSVSDFNTSLSLLMQNAGAKAESRGVLEKANENAESMILNFVYSLLGNDCTVVVTVR